MPAKRNEREEIEGQAKRGSPSAALAGVALLARATPAQRSQSADSTARNLTLAPTESTAALKDVPARAPEAAKPEPEKKAPVKKPVAPKPAAPAPLMLAAGTRVPAAASDTISTRSAKAGDPFSATGSQDVKDATGRVAIPAVATVSGTITAADPAPKPNPTARTDLSGPTAPWPAKATSIKPPVLATATS